MKFRPHLLRLLVLWLAVCPPALATRPKCSEKVHHPHGIIAAKIAEIHAFKGTFEHLHPLDPTSIAIQFPNQYQRILRLFRDRPSHLMGINNGLPPKPGMPMGKIFSNIHRYANEIGEDLGYIVESFPRDYYARPLLQDYVARFRAPATKLSARVDAFDPDNSQQLQDITRYGKSIVCSLWAELRLSLRIGYLSRVNVTVKQLVRDGVIRNNSGFLSQYYDQEMDHFWFPREPNEKQPYAVAIGETKVFDVPFTTKHSNAQKVMQQFRRYLDIASVVGAQLGLPPQINYFFVAGIDHSQMEKMQRIAAEFNESLANVDVTKRSPVEVRIFGHYDGDEPPSAP